MPKSKPAQTFQRRAQPTDTAHRTRPERTCLRVRHRTGPISSRPLVAPKRLDTDSPKESARPASVELLRLADLVRVGAAVVRTRCLEDGRQILKSRVRQEDAELLAELPLEDVRVPVAVRGEWRRGVVDVQRPEPVEADRRVELVETRVERCRVGHVHAGDPEMARVEADAEPRVATEPIVDRCELLDRAPDRPPGAGGVLHQEPRVARAQLEPLLE